jgi:predicted kinase
VARAAVDVGDIVLLDATYSRKWQRDELKRIVGDTGFRGYWLDASIEERLKRLGTRGLDASDAGPDFATKQTIERPACEAPWECLDTRGVGLDELTEALFARVCIDRN